MIKPMKNHTFNLNIIHSTYLLFSAKHILFKNVYFKEAFANILCHM
jgi:hypothetical protein